MTTVSIVFRMPVVDVSGEHPAPFKCFRASDDRPASLWPKCSHKHRTKKGAEKCARSLSLGWRVGSVNERVEIRGFAGHRLIGDGFTAAQRRKAVRS